MQSFFLYSLAFAFIFLITFRNVHSPTHLKLIIKTTQPIDSAFIVHWTDKESIRLPFNDTPLCLTIKMSD